MKLFDENPDVQALCFAVDFVGEDNPDWKLSVNALGPDGANLRPSQKMLMNSLFIYWQNATGPTLDRWFEKFGFLGAFEVFFCSDGQTIIQPRPNMIVDPSAYKSAESISNKQLRKMQKRINKHAMEFIDEVVAHADGVVACNAPPLVILHAQHTSLKLGNDIVVEEVPHGI